MSNRSAWHDRAVSAISVALVASVMAGMMASAVITTVSSEAHAGGVYFTDRGVRPLGRGGAFVAGADDLGAIYYNPAGIVHANRQVFLDTSLVFMNAEFTRMDRVNQVDPNSGELTGVSWYQTHPTSRGKGPLIPIPAAAVSYDFGIEGAAFALGAWTPHGSVASFDQLVNGKPNPGRYMLLSLEGSALIVPGLWAAYKFTPELSVGAGFEMMVGRIQSESMVNGGLPDRFAGPSEEPEYDFLTRLNAGPIFAPSANFGVMFDPHSNIRLGASFQLPFYIDVKTKPEGRLPSAVVFQDAYQSGDEARMKFKFPWMARAGVEARWPKNRVELAFVYEAWSMHDTVSVTPYDIVYQDVLTLKDEYVAVSQTVPRHLKDTWSLRLGGETSFDVSSYRIDLRAGAMYEKSAIPPAYMTTITIDLDKVVLGLGGSFHFTPNFRLDCMVART
ncbi:MAG: outer membrane protein transport protein, partial [Polyangiaceae bacterium]|nr:outer membrane protein transport protein [Polyangiaceae bacterium]